MIGYRYLIDRKESEFAILEVDLAEYLNVPFVKCSYDCINSHKYQDKEEIKYRKAEAKGSIAMTTNLDYVINFEIYDTEENYNKNEGGYDGEVHELHYLKGNGNYIVITDI